MSASLPILSIEGGSHCADMAAADLTVDTTAMQQAREKAAAIIAAWVTDSSAELRAGDATA